MSNSYLRKTENTLNTEIRKTSFPKYWVENAEQDKLILKKRMTTHEQYVKCNFLGDIVFTLPSGAFSFEQ